MNREQANKAVADKIGISGPFTDNLVLALEALGLLKLEKPSRGEVIDEMLRQQRRLNSYRCAVGADESPRTHFVQMDNSQGVVVRESALVDALQAAGYVVSKR